MTPGDLGYVKCFRCGCQRRPGTTSPVGPGGIEGSACSDGCGPASAIPAPQPTIDTVRGPFVSHAGSPSVDCPCGMPLPHAAACGFTVDPEAT